MKHGKCKGSKVNMKVAGNSTQGAMMTDLGEVMMQGGQPKTKYDIGWIVPVCRLQDELGAAVEYQSDGQTVVRLGDGKRLEMKRYQGLTFMDWDDFACLRAQLAESHRRGRPQHKTGRVAAAVKGPIDVHCNKAVATDDQDDTMNMKSP